MCRNRRWWVVLTSALVFQDIIMTMKKLSVRNLRFASASTGIRVSAILMMPEAARHILVLAHGAGAGMKHSFMEALCKCLGNEGIATFRYQFPYMEQGNKRPDFKPVLLATVRAAVSEATKHAGGLPVFAGGKSMGGRMTSLAASETPLSGVKGIVFFGFPLHPAGAPSTTRADHLSNVHIPMLFLQGTRDALADLSLLTPICASLQERATMHIIESGDHSFHVLKSSRRTDDDVLGELAQTTAAWMNRLG